MSAIDIQWLTKRDASCPQSTKTFEYLGPLVELLSNIGRISQKGRYIHLSVVQRVGIGLINRGCMMQYLSCLCIYSLLSPAINPPY